MEPGLTYVFRRRGRPDVEVADWWRLNLNRSYDVTETLQIYGLINNVLDRRYYGDLGDLLVAEERSEASGDTIDFTDPRTIMPATPVAAYGGVKNKFRGGR